jgi:sporulation protein YlmC with PRC-barrel domain
VSGTSDEQPRRPENRLTGPIDGALHLLDRQLIDSEGKLLGKVDDVELSLGDDGLAITAVLTGPAALLSRLGGKLGSTLVERWGQMRVSEPHRTRPWRIEIEDVERLDSAVHLGVRRDGVLRRDREGHRLGRLTGMDVVGPDGVRMGRVLDARFEPGAGGRLVLCSLIVGHGGPGSLLGYDRRSDQGPWLVRTIVRRLHRHTVIVGADDADISWGDAAVRLRSVPRDRPDHAFESG